MEEDLKDLAEKDSLFAAQLRELSKAIDRMGPATWNCVSVFIPTGSCWNG